MIVHLCEISASLERILAKSYEDMIQQRVPDRLFGPGWVQRSVPSSAARIASLGKAKEWTRQAPTIICEILLAVLISSNPSKNGCRLGSQVFKWQVNGKNTPLAHMLRTHMLGTAHCYDERQHNCWTAISVGLLFQGLHAEALGPDPTGLNSSD
jgi:hypothetical protein